MIINNDVQSWSSIMMIMMPVAVKLMIITWSSGQKLWQREKKTWVQDWEADQADLCSGKGCWGQQVFVFVFVFLFVFVSHSYSYSYLYLYSYLYNSSWFSISQFWKRPFRTTGFLYLYLCEQLPYLMMSIKQMAGMWLRLKRKPSTRPNRIWYRWSHYLLGHF